MDTTKKSKQEARRQYMKNFRVQGQIFLYFVLLFPDEKIVA